MASAPYISLFVWYETSCRLIVPLYNYNVSMIHKSDSSCHVDVCVYLLCTSNQLFCQVCDSHCMASRSCKASIARPLLSRQLAGTTLLSPFCGQTLNCAAWRLRTSTMRWRMLFYEVSLLTHQNTYHGSLDTHAARAYHNKESGSNPICHLNLICRGFQQLRDAMLNQIHQCRIQIVFGSPRDCLEGSLHNPV